MVIKSRHHGTLKNIDIENIEFNVLNTKCYIPVQDKEKVSFKSEKILMKKCNKKPVKQNLK